MPLSAKPGSRSALFDYFDRSCWKQKPARPICRTGWSMPIWQAAAA